MVNFKGVLAKLMKPVSFSFSGVEDDSTENANVTKLILTEKLKVTGSNTLDGGFKMIHEDDVLYVHEDDMAEFEKGLKEGDDGIVTYTGNLKLDVSKARTGIRNGERVVVKPAKLWLVSVLFSKRGNGLRAQGQKDSQNAILKYFKYDVPAETGSAAPKKAQGVEITSEVEDEVGG